MLLAHIPRYYLLLSLNLASGKRCYCLYPYILEPSTLREYIRLARGIVERYVPEKFEKLVLRALDELEQLATRLERELSEPSPPLVELVKRVFESIMTKNDAQLKKFIADNFTEISSIVPFDGILTKRFYDTLLVFRPTKSDLSKILYFFTVDDPNLAISNFVEEAFSKSELVRLLYELTGRMVRIDLATMTATIAGTTVHLSPGDMTRILIAFNMQGELREHIVKQYSGLVENLSRRLGTAVEVGDVSITAPEKLGASVELLIDDAGRAAGVSTSKKYRVVINIKYAKGEPLEVEISCRHGVFLVQYAELVVKDEDLCSTIEKTINTDKFRSWLKALDSAVSTILSLGYSMNSFYYDRFNEYVDINAAKEGLEISYKYYPDRGRGDVAVMVKIPKPASTALYHHVYRVEAGEVSFSDRHLVLRASDVLPHAIRRIEEVALREAKKVAGEWVDKYRSLPDIDAAAIYVMYKHYGVHKDIISEKLGLSPASLSLKASRFIRKVAGIPPRLLVDLTNYMLDNGMIAFDDEGYMLVFGKRVVDVSKEYFGSPAYGRTSEKRILGSLLYRYSILDIFKGRRVPARIIELLAEEAAQSKNIPSPTAIEQLLKLAERKDVWTSLSQHEKILVASACKEELIKRAESGNWRWVLDDMVTLVIVSTANLKKPSDLTKILVEKYPNMLGHGYELTKIGDEYFIKYRNVYLQVRKVLYDGLMFQGSMAGSSIGMVVKARNVEEASTIIQNNLMDCVIEYRELVSSIRSAQDENIAIGKHETPLFAVPYAIVKAGYRRISIPLQVGFLDKVERATRRAEEKESRADELSLN